MKRIFVLAWLLAAPLAQAQQLPSPNPPPNPSLDVLLTRLYAYSSDYMATIPSITCNESITSQRVKKNKVTWEVRIEGTLSEVRRDKPNPSDPFEEKHTFRTMNGKPPKKKFKIPYFVQGGFANAVGFHHPEFRDCYKYTLTAGEKPGTVQLRLRLNPDATAPVCSAVLGGHDATTVAEAATGRVLHVERTITEEAARQHKEPFFASVDYVPYRFGDRSFLLPSRFVASDPKDEGRMEAAYSNCHRYAGETRIVPDSVTASDPK